MSTESGGPFATAITVRRFRMGEEQQLYRIFHSAIHLIAARDYTPEQINAWAPDRVDADLWAARIRGNNPFVADIADEPVGFADVQVDGYIDHFFVSGLHPRRGIGRALMNRIHEEGNAMRVSGLYADVSRTAQPFFTRSGFELVEQRAPVLRGVVIPNALMRKRL